jgi:membrane protein required for colicin V production
MQPYDIVMLIVLALAIVWGAWKGLAWQIASLASIALSYLVALNFRQPLAGIINASPPWNVFSAMLILFLGTGLIVWIGFNLVSELIERVKLKEFDRQLGAIFGAAKGVLLCVLITLFSVALLGDSQRQAICNSKSGYYIALLLDRAYPVIPKELHQVLDPYINQLDKTVGQPSRQTAGWQMPIDLSRLFGRFRPASAPVAQPIPPAPPPIAPLTPWTAPQSPPARQPAPAGPASFPTGDFFAPQPAAAESRTAEPQAASLIEAQPHRSASQGSFRQ